ncbi:MAG: hypothetical protein GOU98_01750 [Candidatus Altiarchaeota archaeon]|nr:hypothetical protein [Candidatus Altiarchaeota archaeon]
MRTPKDYFSEHMINLGHTSIKSNERNLNQLAIKLNRGLLGLRKGSFTGSLAEKLGDFSHLLGPGELSTELFGSKKGEKLKLKIPEFGPKIIIDYSLWCYHTKEERNLLTKQMEYTLTAIRDYLWDKNLVFASTPPEIQQWAKGREFFGEILTEKFEGDAIVLDPNAEDVIKNFSPKTNYLIGGIVDKSNRMRTTSLGYDLPRASLRLEGKSSNVSNRINHLVKAICRNLTGERLSEVTPRSRS